MARKHALVVDDSKSARVILSRMLERYDIEVDMAESAEQAIQYLEHNRPDAIFMDHLMPGMDGLQAVKAIKGNPRTATIPIMMYTSQEGELYVGQARALGAMGVLPKQLRAVDVSKVLYELRLLPDRRGTADPALLPVEIEAAAPAEAPQAEAPPAERSPAGAAEAGKTAPDWGRRVEEAIEAQGADLRRFVVASLDSFGARIVGDFRDSMISAPADMAPPVAAAPALWPWMLASVILLASTAVGAMFWATARENLANAREQVTSLTAANAQLQRAHQELTAQVKDLTAAMTANPAAAGSDVAPSTGPAPERIESVPYGEVPADHGRLDVLRELLAKLEGQGFRGTVKITSFAGLFCLAGNSLDGFTPANVNLPIAKCDLLGNPLEDPMTGPQRQSLAFANLVASVRQKTDGAITLVAESGGSARVVAPYPPRTDTLTAGEWNRVAAINNRVEITAEPN